MASIGIGKAVSWFGVARRVAERSTVTAFMAAAVTLTAPGGSVHAQNAQESGLGPEVDAFITRMTREHQFDGLELRQMFSRFEPNKAILKAIDRPATSRPWSYFRKLYVTPTRVEGGVEFWNEHASWLEKARNKYGVPEEIITSIIGVETIYGRYTGKFHVTDALYTLGFEVPRRSRFFQGQFEHFLLLARENEIDPSSVKGSFAGAMGIPQFMPSSYRQYAVDFDGDGRVDLWNSVADAIGSVANYLSRFGWEPGEQVVLPAIVSADDPAALKRLGVKPSLSIEEWQSRGVKADGQVKLRTDAGFFILESEEGPEYWMSFYNFYVITRYNRSNNYAMAVYQLAQEIADKRKSRQAAISGGAGG